MMINRQTCRLEDEQGDKPSYKQCVLVRVLIERYVIEDSNRQGRESMSSPAGLVANENTDFPGAPSALLSEAICNWRRKSDHLVCTALLSGPPT
ncbi:hypothetical protein RRG08_018986 [Elysia crispata]|uniref:Uncharacterized protein n=1 Tax=Elysia crispata TaxID=231223 RepID=A0AAE1A5B5_9GAST|nr:hypothetical protein RRG08_018986 [Elysia crispata]